MRSRSASIRRILQPFLAVVFLAAAQGQALGLRHCSLHDGPAGETSGSAHPVAPADGEHSHEQSRDQAQEGHHHSGEVGGCVDDCHVGSGLASGFVAGTIVSAQLSGAHAGAVEGQNVLHGHRHDLFELHLPNAPPVFA